MINRELEYQPKGGMCANCAKINQNCSSYDFSSMPRISKGDRDGIVIVRCVEFQEQ